MSDKTPTCANCFSSMFRKRDGETFLYCGYHFRRVDVDGTCNDHNRQRNSNKYVPVSESKVKHRVFVMEKARRLEFDSVSEAAVYLCISLSGLSNALRRGTKAHRHVVGYIDNEN